MRKNPVGRLERILARRIRELAAEKDIPLSHVADRAGISRSLLWDVFEQNVSVSLDTIQRLATAFELDDPLELLRGQPAPVKRRTVARRPTKRT